MTAKNIWVEAAADGANGNCLKLYDLDSALEGTHTAKYDIGVAERKRMKRGQDITWFAQVGSSLTITFNNNSPFTGVSQTITGPATGTTTQAVSAVVPVTCGYGRYKYTIELTTVVGGLATNYTEDPQIIIDTTDGSTLGGKKSKSAAKKSKRK